MVRPFKNSLYTVEAGRTIAEWKACETGTKTDCMPIDVNKATASSTDLLSPAITVCVGQFLLATATYPEIFLSSGSILSTEAAIAAILPQSGTLMLAIAVPRVVTARIASGKLKTPAATAAPYSPRLWPMVTSGLMPNWYKSLIMATLAVKIAGWVI